jgi:hypothetical protein
VHLNKATSAPDTAAFLYPIAVDLYQRKQSAIASLDAKAQNLVALVAGGAGLYTLLGGFEQKGSLQITPLLVAAAAAILTSLVLGLMATRPQAGSIPQITVFNSLRLLAEPQAKTLVAWALIEDWQRRAFAMTGQLRAKSRLIFASTIVLVVGVMLLLGNFAVVRYGEPIASRVPTTFFSCVSSPSAHGVPTSLKCWEKQVQ